MDNLHVLSRRSFLTSAALAGGGFAVGFSLSPRGIAAGAPAGGQTHSSVTEWVRITPDNVVTIVVSQAEIGQGISTTLPAILADELGADWDRIHLHTAAFAPAYRNPRVSWMFTGNSESVQSFHDLMRRTGAAARTMLITAAARRWRVRVSECVARNSTVTHTGSKRSATFGELAAAAARIPVPQSPKLKDSAQLRLVGRSLQRLDVPEKVDGSAIFGIDFKVPDMLTAAVRTAPAIGGRLASFDEAAIKSSAGVRAVVPVTGGLAVVADTYWQARSALLQGSLRFAASEAASIDSSALQARYRNALDNGPWVNVVNQGNTETMPGTGATEVLADYESPFAAHATLEPMNCTASVTADRCEIWAPTQGQELAFHSLKAVLGLRDDQVVVNRVPYVGGGFGRRLIPDFVLQAALISRAVGQPVKVIWDREEDFRRDAFRPASLVHMSATLDTHGLPAAFTTRSVSPTILLPVFPTIQEVLDKQQIDPSALEGMLELPYSIANRRFDFHLLRIPVPTSVMRGTGYCAHIFALECFVDELAAAAQADPLAYRRKLLGNNTRMIAVLDRAAALSGWGTSLAPNHGRGLALTHAFGSLFVQVIDVEIRGDAVRVKRVVSVVDCGRTLDPGIATACIEGGTLFGLAYCTSEITFRDGAVVEDNFDRYALPFLSQTPELITQFVESGTTLGGIGEVSPVTVPPALANAIFSATGRRVRSMPLARHGLRLI